MADHSNLPAPYESPWRQLGRAARAVVASLGLDLRSLWRRNRSGELPRVPWWPRDLAPLFWPLVLAAGLSLVLLSASWLVGLHRQPQPGPGPLSPAAEAIDASMDASIDAAIDASIDAAIDTGADGVLEPSAAAPAEASPDSTDNATPGEADQPDADPSDALRDRIGADDHERWIVAADATPERQLVVLKLEEGFNRQDPLARRRQAERWLERIRELGFEQLELRSRDGELLGYRARVGSGMILLEPAASA